MRPPFWHPPIARSPAEHAIMTHIKRAKLFVFLREHRHKLFDDAFQEELAALYAPSRRGHPPIPPAQLALATILQAYTGVSDDEVIEATLMDRPWQLVLDCLDTEQAPFEPRHVRRLSKASHRREDWIDGSSNERSKLPATPRSLDHGLYSQHWTAAHYGERAEWKTHTIW